MLNRFLPFLSLAALLLASACSVAPIEAPVQPTAQAVVVSITPAAAGWGRSIRDCAAAHPEAGLFLIETPAPALDPMKADLLIRLGEPGQAEWYAAQIGQEEITMIAHPDLAGIHISAANLAGLMSGEITNWNRLQGPDQGVQVWTYPKGDELRQALDAAVKTKVTADANLAPDPQAMLDAVSQNPGAIGYAPASWLKDQPETAVQRLDVDPELSAALHLPVLALSAAEPQGLPRALLICMQKNSGE